MCDTMVALGSATIDGATLFAKNSDRDANEAQNLEIHPAQEHSAEARLKATYIEIPQASETNRVLLSRPYWMWGAEMGANEQGVVIGNEAVFAIRPANETLALTGMDLLRLGLERGNTAENALKVIIALLEEHGQGGNCGHTVPFYYDNSFLIADATEAFVLETCDRHWAVEHVTDGVRAISNTYSIGTQIDAQSDGLLDFARGLGWQGAEFNFTQAFQAQDHPSLARRLRRQNEARACLAQPGRKSVADMMAYLRNHGPAENDSTLYPGHGLETTICAHTCEEGMIAQTTGSMVSRLTESEAEHFVTGTSAPCLSLFRPLDVSGEVPDRYQPASGTYDPKSLWWRHEKLHRRALLDIPHFWAKIKEDQARFETDLLEGKIADPWRMTEAYLDRWTMDAQLHLKSRPQDQWAPTDKAFQQHWANLNQSAQFPS